MLFRVLQFILGAALSGGGGYLAWTQRGGAANLFPPGPEGLPLLLLVGILGVAAGIVFLISAVHPRPNQKRAAAEKTAREDAALDKAEVYYSESTRAADRDWRSAPIPPPAAPAPLPAAPVAPTRVAPPPPAPPPVPPPPQAAPVAAPFKATLVQPPPAPVPQPTPPKPVMQPAAPVAPAPAPVPTARPPSSNPFPSPVTLNPIPKAASAPVPPPPPKPPTIASPVEGPHMPIRAAIAAGKLAEAEQMLNSARDGATGLDLAYLTALAGDHAAAAGQQSHAKWLWRLATKRFGENDATGAPDAQRIAALLGPAR